MCNILKEKYIILFIYYYIYCGLILEIMQVVSHYMIKFPLFLNSGPENVS